MDFMSDELFDGRRFRLLTIVDDFTRESLAIEVDQRLTGNRVAEVLGRIGRVRGLPDRIRVDNGTEFTSKRLDQWAYLTGVNLEFSRRGKPTDNGLIEAFNGRLRAECLNENWFLSLDDARSKVESWRRHYNGDRPHSALGNLAPRVFAASRSQVDMAGRSPKTHPAGGTEMGTGAEAPKLTLRVVQKWVQAHSGRGWRAKRAG